VAADRKFTITSHKLDLLGICNECQ
jgi:Fe2+ or Zn2+ uptake regulation protein